MAEKKSLSVRDAGRLKRASIENTKATARQLQLSLDGKYSSLPTRSIRRYLQKLGRRAYRPRKCLKWSQTDMKKRLDWCRFHEHFTVDDWNFIIFSDEAYIELNFNGNPQYVRRLKFDPIHFIKK